MKDMINNHDLILAEKIPVIKCFLKHPKHLR